MCTQNRGESQLGMHHQTNKWDKSNGIGMSPSQQLVPYCCTHSFADDAATVTTTVTTTATPTIITTTKTNNSQWIIVFIVLISLSNTNMAITKTMHMTQHNNHANISELLNNLLRGYDNSVRPGFGGMSLGLIMRDNKMNNNNNDKQKTCAFLFLAGAPAIVEVDIMVRSMGPISEVDMV